MAQITMKALLEAGVHFGHQVRKWNPKMAKYIFGERNKIHIIDLQKTVKELKKVYKFVREVASKGEPILFVGTKKQAIEPIETEAKRCGAFYVSERWIGGTLTNFSTIRKSVARLKELEKMKKEGIFDLLSKKERSKREKEMKKLEEALSGIKEMEKLPGLVFIVDPVEEEVAVREARKMSIPIVAICDTDSDPDCVDYVIPGNDDAVRAIKLFCSIIADAVLEGKESVDKKQQEVITEEIRQYPETGISTEELEKEIKLEG